MLNIVIPTYRARDTLPLALKSLEAQTKNLFLVTIVQDCDGEDYSDIIEASSLNITLLHTPRNGGPALARQVGLEATFGKCDFIMFMDADDLLMPNAVESLTREINRTSADVIVSNFYTEKKGVGLEVYKSDGNATWLHGKIYRVSYLQQNGINFLTSIRVNEDSNFNMKALLTTAKCGHIEEITYLWRDVNTSITRRDTLTFFVNGVNDFIYGQLEALRFIKSKLGSVDPELLGKVFGFVYNWYQISKEKDGAPDDELVKEFLAFEDLQYHLQNKKFVQVVLNDKVRGNFVGYGFCVFFHESVDFWYTRLTGKMLVGE